MKYLKLIYIALGLGHIQLLTPQRGDVLANITVLDQLPFESIWSKAQQIKDRNTHVNDDRKKRYGFCI